MLELYRAVIPANRVINDNHGQHYRTIQYNLQWLTGQFEMIKNGYYIKSVGRGRGVKKERIEYSGPNGFIIPPIEKVKEYLYSEYDELGIESKTNENPIINIRCEVWKPRNLRFDPQNYAHTFKSAIDMLTKYGYIIDDNWKFVNGITYVGGGPEVWNKRLKRDNIIVEHNNLPDELTIDWWKSECSEDYNDLFIRILIEKE